MKRTILTGLLAFVAGMTTLMAQAPAAAPKGPAPKSKSEMEALQALQAAQGDPDKTIAVLSDAIQDESDFTSVPLRA